MESEEVRRVSYIYARNNQMHTIYWLSKSFSAYCNMFGWCKFLSSFIFLRILSSHGCLLIFSIIIWRVGWCSTYSANNTIECKAQNLRMKIIIKYVSCHKHCQVNLEPSYLLHPWWLLALCITKVLANTLHIYMWRHRLKMEP